MAEWFSVLWERIRSVPMQQWQWVIRPVLFALLGWLLIRVVVRSAKRLLDAPTSRLRGAAGGFIASLIRIALIVLYGIILLSMLGVDTTSLVAIFSVLTLAVSLAVQGVIANLASGFMLVVTKPFDKGDYVEIGGVAGTVEDIRITCTRLCTPDNKVITLPNSTVTAAEIVNYSARPTRRLELVFGVAYGTDVALVKAVVLRVIAEHGAILPLPMPLVRLGELGASALHFTVRVWVKQADYWDVSFDLREQVSAALEAAGIRIPYPQMDVHLAGAVPVGDNSALR